MTVDRKTIAYIKRRIPEKLLQRIEKAALSIVKAKEKGRKVVAVIGSGPNLHEGVTTLIAELINKGIIDGVTTSSAVINHEMGGTLEKVKRIRGSSIGLKKSRLPADGYVEASIIPPDLLKMYERYNEIDMDLYRKMLKSRGNEIIKVAGNIAYPTGLYTEIVSRYILKEAKRKKVPFEIIAGKGSDKRTMIGAGAEKGVPVLVSVPQMVGGGEVGLAIGDSIAISKRSRRVAELIASADVIIESAIALTQEIHDGPFELYTGHGIWKDYSGEWTYSLAEKKVIRIDMDVNLERAWNKERRLNAVSKAVDKGLPKTKHFKMPFRMEMSGFARIPGSLPVIGDIGMCWPVMATMAADALGVTLDFMCYKQSLSAGKEMREWIVNNIKPFDVN